MRCFCVPAFGLCISRIGLTPHKHIFSIYQRALFSQEVRESIIVLIVLASWVEIFLGIEISTQPQSRQRVILWQLSTPSWIRLDKI